MSEENSLRFWIIPIISMVGIVLFLGVFGINYVIHTIPLAEEQQREILQMNCEEIENFPSDSVLYTTTNRKLLADSTNSCAEIRKAIKAKENEILKEKLKDPSSVESLLKEFRQQTILQNTFQKDYDYYLEASQKSYKGLTDANDKISEIQSHPNWPEVLKRLNQEKNEK